MSGMLYAIISVCRSKFMNAHTLEYALDFGHLCRIIEFPELFCLLRQFLSLYQGVALVPYEIRCGIVEGGYERGKIDICCTLSVRCARDGRDYGIRTSPRGNRPLEFILFGSF